MPLNVTVGEKLLEDARRLGRHETDSEAVAVALKEQVKRCGQLKVIELFGTIDYDPDYDYKAERRRKRG